MLNDEIKKFSIDEVIAYNKGYKQGCADTQETFYKLFTPLLDDCIRLENEIREKIYSAPDNVHETPFPLRVDWHATLRERTAFREMLENVIKEGGLICLTAKS